MLEDFLVVDESERKGVLRFCAMGTSGQSASDVVAEAVQDLDSFCHGPTQPYHRLRSRFQALTDLKSRHHHHVFGKLQRRDRSSFIAS